MLHLLAASLLLAATANGEGKCKMDGTSYFEIPEGRALEWYQINLDDPAETRWQQPIADFKDGINKMINLTMNSPLLADTIIELIQLDSRRVLERFPYDYGDEIKAIAAQLGREVADLIIFNLAYELFGFCTSIVAQDETGHVYHARNLDFGLFPAVNWSDVQWDLTEDLRPILFNANFTKDGQPLYQTVVFGGYVGVLTGVRQGAMTITVDSRYDDNFDKYLLDWFTDEEDDSQFLTFTTRTAMEQYDSYDDALTFIQDTSFVGPSYIIMGGVEKDQGAIVSIGPNMTLLDTWSIPDAYPNITGVANWFVVETNYDHWEPPPSFDDRRYPAIDCMNDVGTKGIDLPMLYNVLNGIPNRNRLTTYTALMDASLGYLESYKQYCDEVDCIPW